MQECLLLSVLWDRTRQLHEPLLTLPAAVLVAFPGLKAANQNLHTIKKRKIPVPRSLSKRTWQPGCHQSPQNCSLSSPPLSALLPHRGPVAVPTQRSCSSWLTGGMGSSRGFRVGQESPSPGEVSGTVTALGCLQGGANLVCCCLHLCVYENSAWGSEWD